MFQTPSFRCFCFWFFCFWSRELSACPGGYISSCYIDTQVCSSSCRFEYEIRWWWRWWCWSLYLLRFDFKAVTDWELLCQLRFLWLMNQLLICFSCNPVSSTSFALSSSCKNASNTWTICLKQITLRLREWANWELTVGYGHFECCCHQFFNTEVVSPGSFPALLFLRISSLTSSILDLNPCRTFEELLYYDLSYPVTRRRARWGKMNIEERTSPAWVQSSVLAVLSPWESFQIQLEAVDQTPSCHARHPLLDLMKNPSASPPHRQTWLHHSPHPDSPLKLYFHSVTNQLYCMQAQISY